MLKALDLKTIVIKVGTKVLSGKGYCMDKDRIRSLVAQVADIKKRGIKVVMVSSGAICSGMGLLGLKRRPSELSQLQACAAVGQAHLMQIYDNFFKAHNILTAQILLTQEDLNDRKRYLNAKATLETLLKEGVVPIVNENDTVATDEIKFGDNDKLSSLVANLISADLLILVSDVDGLCKIEGSKQTIISVVDKINSDIMALVQGSADELGRGGMSSKLQAANTAISSGLPCIIVNGKKENILTDIIDRKPHGTLFLPQGVRMAERKRWLGFSAKTKGGILVDDGAKEALVKKDKSLLSSGIVGTSGEFKKGDIIAIIDANRAEFARGISNYSRDEIEKIKGLKTSQIAKTLGCKGPDEVVHKDNLVIL